MIFIKTFKEMIHSFKSFSQLSKQMSSQISKKAKKINRNKTTQITNPLDWNIDQLNFDPVSEGSIPGQNIANWRIPMYTKNKDGTEGELIIQCDRTFSFGVSPNETEVENPETKVKFKTLNGYSASLSMWDQDGATPMQVATTDLITAVVEKVKDHLLSDEVMNSVSRFSKDGLERSDLKKLDPLYWKREKGKIVEGKGPTWYPKLIWYKASVDAKTKKERPANMETIFYSEDEVDEEGNPKEVDPLEYLSQRCYLTPLIKIESVYIGAKITLQCKIYESYVKESEGGKKRLLHNTSSSRPTISTSNPLTRQTTKPVIVSSSASSDSSSVSSSSKDEVKEEKVMSPKKEVKKEEVKQEITAEDDDEDHDEEKPTPPPKKPAIKKVAIKAKKTEE
jgi:hypothetical protein